MTSREAQPDSGFFTRKDMRNRRQVLGALDELLNFGSKRLDRGVVRAGDM